MELGDIGLRTELQEQILRAVPAQFRSRVAAYSGTDILPGTMPYYVVHSDGNFAVCTEVCSCFLHSGLLNIVRVRYTVWQVRRGININRTVAHTFEACRCSCVGASHGA